MIDIGDLMMKLVTSPTRQRWQTLDDHQWFMEVIRSLSQWSMLKKSVEDFKNLIKTDWQRWKDLLGPVCDGRMKPS